MLRRPPSATLSSRGVLLLLLLLLALAAHALAHGGDNDAQHGSMDMKADMEMHSSPTPTPSAPAPDDDDDSGMSYFAYDKHFGSILAHIVLMVLAWFFVLPAGVMLSIARSRLALPTQFLFLVINAFGLLLGVIYNSQTPDLYENNAHHKIGWIATWVMSAQVVMTLLFAYAGKDHHGVSSKRGSSVHERVGFIPVATHAPDARHQYRWSGDSGQGTERSSSSLHEPGYRDSQHEELNPLAEKPGDLDDEDSEDDEEMPSTPTRRNFFRNSIIDKFLSARVPRFLSGRLLKALRVVYVTIERTILILGFVAMSTGGVTYGGIFKSHHIFSGLAHFIKGGIFVWYGLFSLGRWMGCFADVGWAWNLKPSRGLTGRLASRVPSAEFMESLLIFVYGCSNVFLEHLAAWGEAWSAMDLEHVSIAIMFFGVGMCGMLAESRRIRNWVNKAAFPHQTQYPSEELELPKSHTQSLNPMPAIVVFLLGLMMISHHQSSMVSTMVHKQWGMLLAGAALCRALTYIILYLSPSTSVLPARPPSELVGSFCLISGGLVFMLSARDVVTAMEKYELHAMFVFTVAMGFTAFVMAWEIACIALKAWASSRTATRRAESTHARGFRFPNSSQA